MRVVARTLAPANSSVCTRSASFHRRQWSAVMPSPCAALDVRRLLQQHADGGHGLPCIAASATAAVGAACRNAGERNGAEGAQHRKSSQQSCSSSSLCVGGDPRVGPSDTRVRSYNSQPYAYPWPPLRPRCSDRARLLSPNDGHVQIELVRHRQHRVGQRRAVVRLDVQVAFSAPPAWPARTAGPVVVVDVESPIGDP